MILVMAKDNKSLCEINKHEVFIKLKHEAFCKANLHYQVNLKKLMLNEGQKEDVGKKISKKATNKCKKLLMLELKKVQINKT